MKHAIKWVSILIIMTVMWSTHAEEVWKITSLNWEPYSGATIASQGNAIQELRELLKKADIRLIVEFCPWKRAQLTAKGPDYVGYFPAWPEEVADGFVASPPIDWSEISILKRADTELEFNSIDELFEKYTVGIIHTYVYPKVITDAMAKYPNHVDKTPNEASLLKKLSVGRCQAAITDPNVMMYLAETEGISNITPVQVVMKKELVLALRDQPDNQARIDLLKKLLDSN